MSTTGIKCEVSGASSREAWFPWQQQCHSWVAGGRGSPWPWQGATPFVLGTAQASDGSHSMQLVKTTAHRAGKQMKSVSRKW